MARFGRFGFGEAISSRSWRTEVPWNPTGSGASRSTSPVSFPSIFPVGVGCTRETSIGGRTFAVSFSKNLHLKLTSRLLLKGPRIFASVDLGSACIGRVGGCCSCFAVREDDPLREIVDVSSAVISGEYTGGREDSTGGMIDGGSGVDGSLRNGWKEKVELFG